jgi:methylmalonyl-CoA/ethylmalonyl-CoA epimerase
LIKKIAYIGVAVNDIDEAKKTYTETLDLDIIREGESTIDLVRNVYLTLGEDIIELIQPYDQNSTVAKFLNRRGEGIQYIGLEVNNLDEVMKELLKKGVRLTSENPVEYPNGSRWAFIHPKAMHGVLIALIENPK